MNDATAGCFIGGMSEYRDGVKSECSGVFHQVEFKWTRGGTAFVGKVVTANVCDGHMDQFKALGEREGYQFTIESVDGKAERQRGQERET